MAAISKNRDMYRALFEAAPNDKFSVARFDSGQEGPGVAHVVLLEKPVELPPASVLSLLWSREFVFIEEWDLETSKGMCKVWDYALSGRYISNEFTRFVNRGAFSPILPSVGIDRIKRCLQDVRFNYSSENEVPDNSFSERCAGQIKSLKEFHYRLTGFEFLQVFKITDDWNAQSYFFETHLNFGYFSWGTSA